MTTLYPGALDSFVNPGPADTEVSVSHRGQHGNANDAIAALQRRVGTGPSVAPAAGQVLLGTAAGASDWRAIYADWTVTPAGWDRTWRAAKAASGGAAAWVTLLGDS